MGSPTLTPTDEGYDFTISGTQHFGPAHVSGDFCTDTELDPTVRILQDITNDTTFDWTDYHITIGMTKSFTISAPVAPAGWDATIIAPLPNLPLPGDISPGTGWVGTINYVKGLSGDPVVITDDAIFGFKIVFTGTTNFYTAQTPTPEPTTITLLGLGAIALFRKRSV